MKLKHKKSLLVISLGLVFFLIYSSLYFSVNPWSVDNDMWIFNTPDETANYFFISQLVSNHSLTVYEGLNDVSGDLNLVHPRSTTVIGNYIAPGSFLGFILLVGSIASIFGIGIIPYVTPLFSILAAFCFYKIIKHIFNGRLALVSAILLLATPAFWYYNSRSLFNNVLFIDFIIIGLFLLFNFFRSKKYSWLIASGIIFGLGLSMRLSDIVWVSIILLSIFIFNRSYINWRDWLIMAGAVAVGVLPSLALQSSIYGHVFVTGYTPAIADQLSGGSFYLNLIKQIFLPFGINFINIFSNIYYFFIDMFFWQFYLSLIGFIILAGLWYQKKLSQKIKFYIIVSILVSVFISIYYGSFGFFDNLMNAPLIGSSQTRYLLPVYILSVPYIAYFIDWASSKANNIKQQYIITTLLVVCFIFLSANSVLRTGPESLWSVKDTLINYHNINKQVMSVTEDDAVIVSSYHDKLFFPKRAVAFYWQDKAYLDNLFVLSREVPVYFYSIDWQNDINYIIDNSVLESELIIEINDTEALYRLW